MWKFHTVVQKWYSEQPRSLPGATLSIMPCNCTKPHDHIIAALTADIAVLHEQIAQAVERLEAARALWPDHAVLDNIDSALHALALV